MRFSCTGLVIVFSKLYRPISDTLILWMILCIVKMNEFRGDVTGISALTK